MRKWMILALALPACSNLDSDRHTNYGVPHYDTRIDFQPPSQAERVKQLNVEKAIFEQREGPLVDKLEGYQAERAELYRLIEHEFPECRRQRHCIAEVSKGDVKRFERYQEVSKQLIALDAKVNETDADLKDWRWRHNLRTRAIYNRYLVTELMKMPTYAPQIRDILVHSVESYQDRRSLTYRLLNITDDSFVATVVGDLEYRMLGRPIDQAAVIATFDIALHPHPKFPNATTRYFVTLLINTHQVDPQFYEAGFLKEWVKRLAQPGQQELRKEVFCGLYSMAGPVLAPKLDPSKVHPCAEARLRMQAPTRDIFDHNMPPETWIMPITYARADNRGDGTER